ncbi:hypothetical protein [Smaragdicoccus niigatensis]|nr:hypothetical protein [Smaragdicoccus niigatensis]
MTAVLVLLLLLAVYVAALKWIPAAGVSADQERVDREIAAMRAHRTA